VEDKPSGFEDKAEELKHSDSIKEERHYEGPVGDL
jgi:hypothetical protein